ncbi:MAG TPA: M1 family metallopeptidase [Anaerolineales bacterium]
MSEEKSNSRWLIFGSVLGLVLAIAALIYLNPFTTPTGQATYLEKQTAAMRPEFHRDVRRLNTAPRYTLTASVNPEAGTLNGQMTLEFTNTTSESLSEIVLRLYPNASDIYGGGSLSVSRVTRGETPLETELSEGQTVLRIFLNSQLAPGQTVTIDLVFDAQIPLYNGQGYGIYSRARDVTTLAGWYPVLAPYRDGWITPPVPEVGDAMLAETSFYEVSLTAPAGYELASTGTVIDQQTNENQTTWQIISGPVREFALALSPGFEILQTREQDVTLRLYALPSASAGLSPEQGLDIIAEAFNILQERFGPYPYNEFEVVETVVSIGGYEFPGMVYLDDGLRAEEPVDTFQYLAAHEIAHQWWYNLVGNHTIEQPWLDEAHAAYAGVLYFEDADSPRAGELFLSSWQNTYGERAAGEPAVNSSALNFPVGPPTVRQYTSMALSF